ncbi:hypothetical protein ACH42_09875 [Endozoicomonas sp. (ex Bugula neritina AB1)]|nr:hypothetical protein ACH42_09875 [Endozoicomonas sp. (ex Bugula neritina AB1)]
MQAAPLEYHLTGLNDELEKNAALYLQTLPPIELSQLKRMQPKIREAVQGALMALGYYSPSIQISPDKENKQSLTINVQSGNPVIIRNINLSMTGDALEDKAFKQLLNALPLKEGDILNHSIYESVKSELNDLALSRGYFDAKLTSHSIKIYPPLQAADITLTLNSGHRYRFGDIHYDSMSPATEKLLATLINFIPGEEYQAIKLSTLNRDISSTGYFSQIDIHPIRDKAVDYYVPVFIGVKPKTAHEIETGIGYATDEGFRISLGWNKPWLNEKGHSIRNELKLSQINAEITSSYKIPAGNPLRDYYNLEAGYKQTQQDDTNSTLFSASVNRWAKRPEYWDRNLFLRFEYEDYIQADIPGHSLLLIPGVAYNRRVVRSSDGLDPKEGQLHNVKLEVSYAGWGSDTFFVKLWGRTKWLTTIADKHRFLGRAEQGFIEVDRVDKLPPSIRFFTGGDQSVRGYSYENISPRDENDKLIGAQYMTAVSVEYNYEFIEKWRLATFIDTGTATNTYRDDWKIGTGVGFRWVSPLGPLKIDLAWAISEPNAPWRIHFSMGPDI